MNQNNISTQATITNELRNVLGLNQFLSSAWRTDADADAER